MIRIVFWDVQHGHAAYLATDNRHIVFDLGTGSYSSGQKEFSPLLHLKNKWGVAQLDAAIITHPHSDHLWDITNFSVLSPAVLHRPKHLTAEEIREGNAPSDRLYVDKYIEIDQQYTSPVTDTTNPFLPANNGGVSFDFFCPTKCARSNLNNHSVVTVVTHAGSKIIIPGDNESTSWNELFEIPRFAAAIASADILLAPHHGREAGYSDLLFEHISPYLTIVSDGAETDTSAVSRYSAHSRGWKVHKRNGGTEQRKCVTTRSDGVIVVEFGKTSETTPYIKVTID